MPEFVLGLGFRVQDLGFKVYTGFRGKSKVEVLQHVVGGIHLENAKPIV